MSVIANYRLLIINGAILSVCAVLNFPWQTVCLTGLMLLLPLLDSGFQPEISHTIKQNLFIKLLFTASLAILAILNPDKLNLILINIFLVALPEEWFFRGWFLNRLTSLQTPAISNLITSALFSLLHIPQQGMFGLTVFFPSFIFGYIYLKYKDITLVILLHALSNILFIIYLKTFI